uniref:Nickel/cobalt efflux system n=1 Tax=OCS116 cluster bacterium TaxID=2030921 RepID=A0A2A4Z2J4_9PROT
MRLILITLLLLSFGLSSALAADNVFRPQKNSNLEQSNQFIPKPLMPMVKKIRQLQAQYLAQVTETLRQIKQDKQSLFPLSLLLLSFIYGLLHAAGPGHGKAVISAYLLSTKAQLRQGIQIAFFASMLQAVTAISITFAGMFLLQFSVRSINQTFSYFEQFSYGLIATLGLYLLVSHMVKINRRNPASPSHVHDEDCDCGHDHMPAPQPGQNLKQKLLTIFSIGIRPCTGALIILILAHSLQLYGTAILATFLMAFGTFITISLVATFAVSLQKISQKFSGNMSSKYKKSYTYIVDALKITLYLFILGFGLLLIIATI